MRRVQWSDHCAAQAVLDVGPNPQQGSLPLLALLSRWLFLMLLALLQPGVFFFFFFSLWCTLFKNTYSHIYAALVAQMVKNSPAMRET